MDLIDLSYHIQSAAMCKRVQHVNAQLYRGPFSMHAKARELHAANSSSAEIHALCYCPHQFLSTQNDIAESIA